jgi:SAM-dependent methyltransferase
LLFAVGAVYISALSGSFEVDTSVIANDIADEHLRAIATLAERERERERKRLRNNLELLKASLPTLPSVQPLDAVQASYVLHFLSGPEMQEAARWMANVLKPRGWKLVQTISPFAGHFRRFHSEYSTRSAAGMP